MLSDKKELEHYFCSDQILLPLASNLICKRETCKRETFIILYLRLDDFADTVPAKAPPSGAVCICAANSASAKTISGPHCCTEQPKIRPTQQASSK